MMKMNEAMSEMIHTIIIITVMIIVMVIDINMVMINVMINVFLSIQIIRVFTHSSIIYISWLVWISPSFVIDFIIFCGFSCNASASFKKNEEKE